MRRVALAAGAVVVLGWPWAVLRYFVFLASLIVVNSIVAIGLHLLSGYTNQLSFGHAGFLAIGASGRLSELPAAHLRCHPDRVHAVHAGRDRERFADAFA